MQCSVDAECPRRLGRAEPDRLEDDRRVEVNPVERDLLTVIYIYTHTHTQRAQTLNKELAEKKKTHIEREPRVRRADQNLHILPLGEVAREIAAGGFGRDDLLRDAVWVDDERAAREEVLDVDACLLHVSLDVHRESGCLRDGESEV